MAVCEHSDRRGGPFAPLLALIVRFRDAFVHSTYHGRCDSKGLKEVFDRTKLLSRVARTLPAMEQPRARLLGVILLVSALLLVVYPVLSNATPGYCGVTGRYPEPQGFVWRHVGVSLPAFHMHFSWNGHRIIWFDGCTHHANSVGPLLLGIGSFPSGISLLYQSRG